VATESISMETPIEVFTRFLLGTTRRVTMCLCADKREHRGIGATYYRIAGGHLYLEIHACEWCLLGREPCAGWGEKTYNSESGVVHTRRSTFGRLS